MRRITMIILVICIVVLLSSTIFSIVKFRVWNPFSSGMGMIEILFTDKEYTIVQNFPQRVAFSKTDTSKKSAKENLDEYMKSRGFYQVPGKRLGAIICYSNGSREEHIDFSQNGYYGKWVWQ